MKGTVAYSNSRSGERGAIKIKTALTFLIIGIVAFAAIKIAPVYVEEQQVFHDADDLARKASMGLNAYSGPKIQTDIQDLIRSYQLPEGSVTLVSQEPEHAQIAVKYTRPIDFIVTTYNWNVDYTAVGKAGL